MPPAKYANLYKFALLANLKNYEYSVGDRDGIANWRVMQARLNAMQEAGIDTEFHVYPGLGHGFGLGTGTNAEGWLGDAVAFWEKQMGT